MSSTFSLRKLEMAMPYLNNAENQDPKSLVSLAALALADEGSLKLIAAGNTETFQVFMDKAYDMDSDKVAALLSHFIQGSARFKMCLDGLTPEEVNQIMSLQQKKMREEKGLV